MKSSLRGARRRFLSAVAAFPLALGMASGAGAQEAWPGKPVRLIVPSAPGGGTDLYARILGQGLAARLNQPFVIDNRPGASGNIGALAAAKAAPDGYTFMVTANPSLTINPSLYPSLPYDPRQFVPVTRGVMAPMALVVNPEVPARTVRDLVELGRKQPGKLAYGSGGNGTPVYLGVRMLEEAASVRFIHVPYKGVGGAYADLLGGRLQFMFPDIASAMSQIRAGKLRTLAVTQATNLLPGVPTLAEAGYPLDVFISFSVVAPPGTPPEIVQRLSEAIAAVMRTKAVDDTLDAQMLVPVFDSPREFAASLAKEREVWERFIRRNSIAPE